MDFTTIVQMSLRNIRRHVIRSALASLGIIIGVAAVVSMVSIGNSAKARIEIALASYDSSQVMVSAVEPEGIRERVLDTGRRFRGLSVGDYKAIVAAVRNISHASLIVGGAGHDVASPARELRMIVYGVDVDGADLLQRKYIGGSQLASSDIQRASTVCLLTLSTAKKLFPKGNALGHVVRIRGIPFLVAGLIADTSTLSLDAASFGDDLMILIPYTTYFQRMSREAVAWIQVRASSPSQIEDVRSQISNVLEARRGRRNSEFRFFSESADVQSYVDTERAMTRLLALVGTLSLFVGGIGIMNVMLVATTERTREIGVWLALGTRRSDLLRHFLYEAAVLSASGGIIGIVLGSGVSIVIAYMNEWPTRITPASIAVAFIGSAAVGLVSGYYPARRAAHVDPAISLRNE